MILTHKMDLEECWKDATHTSNEQEFKKDGQLNFKWHVYLKHILEIIGLTITLVLIL